MKTFNEWLKLQEGGLSGYSYGGRSLADKYGSYLRPLTDDFHPKTGMLRELSQAVQQQVIKTLERTGLSLSRHGNRFEVKDDEGNVEFSSSNISDLVKTLQDAYGSGDDSDVYSSNASIRASAAGRMRRSENI